MENFDNDITELYERLDLYILSNYESPVGRSRSKESSGRKFARRKVESVCYDEEPLADEACAMVQDVCLDVTQSKSNSFGHAVDYCRLPSNFEDAVLDRLEDSFGTLLVKTINKKGLVNSEVYKDANIDRRLFSKIISNEGYSPTKGTVLALAIALKLNLDETTSLLKSAGYALSHSSKSDLVVEFFITNMGGHYNIDVVNDALEHFGQPLLGSKL